MRGREFQDTWEGRDLPVSGSDWVTLEAHALPGGTYSVQVGIHVTEGGPVEFRIVGKREVRSLIGKGSGRGELNVPFDEKRRGELRVEARLSPLCPSQAARVTLFAADIGHHFEPSVVDELATLAEGSK